MINALVTTTLVVWKSIKAQKFLKFLLDIDDKYVILGALQMRQDIKEMIDYLVKYIEKLKDANRDMKYSNGGTH